MRAVKTLASIMACGALLLTADVALALRYSVFKLPTGPTAKSSTPYDLNASGQVVGKILDVSGTEQAVLWQGDSVTYLTGLGAANLEARGINDAGFVAG